MLFSATTSAHGMWCSVLGNSTALVSSNHQESRASLDIEYPFGLVFFSTVSHLIGSLYGYGVKNTHVPHPTGVSKKRATLWVEGKKS